MRVTITVVAGVAITVVVRVAITVVAGGAIIVIAVAYCRISGNAGIQAPHSYFQFAASPIITEGMPKKAAAGILWVFGQTTVSE